METAVIKTVVICALMAVICGCDDAAQGVANASQAVLNGVNAKGMRDKEMLDACAQQVYNHAPYAVIITKKASDAVFVNRVGQTSVYLYVGAQTRADAPVRKATAACTTDDDTRLNVFFQFREGLPEQVAQEDIRAAHE